MIDYRIRNAARAERFAAFVRAGKLTRDMTIGRGTITPPPFGE